jgi:hypothetical protein
MSASSSPTGDGAVEPTKQPPIHNPDEPDDHDNNQAYGEMLPSVKGLNQEQRLTLGVQAFNDAQEAGNPMSIKKTARLYGVPFSTLRRRKMGKLSKKEAGHAMQRLGIDEEAAMRDFIIHMAKLGTHIHANQLYSMAEMLLGEKDDTNALGKKWVTKFIARNPQINGSYVSGYHKNKWAAEEPEILFEMFKLFKDLRDGYAINYREVWAMDRFGSLSIFKLPAPVEPNAGRTPTITSSAPSTATIPASTGRAIPRTRVSVAPSATISARGLSPRDILLEPRLLIEGQHCNGP